MAHNIYNMSDKRYSDLKKSICGNQDVEKLVKKAVMITGKKEKEIRNLVLKAMIQIEAQTGNPALEVYAKAVKNSTPLFDSTSQTNKERAEAIAAITGKTHTKAKLPTHTEVKNFEGLDRDSIVLLEQIRTVDKRRLKQYMGIMSAEVMARVDKALAISIGIPQRNPS